MITQSINLNLIPRGVPPRFRVSQYDVGSRTLTFVLYNGTQKFTTAGVSAQIRGTKPDKHGFEYSATYNNGVVTCDIEQQMTIVAGEVECELILTLNSQVLGTANFILDVEKAALGNDTDISETEIPDIIDLAESHALVAEGYALGKQNGTDVGSSSPYYHNNSKYYKEQAATSATNAANSATAAATSATNAAASEAAAAGYVYGVPNALSIDVDGNPIEGNFAAGVVDKLTEDIQPIQNLHGYANPWIGGGGKNKLPITVEGIKAANSSSTRTWDGNVCTFGSLTAEVLTDDDGNFAGVKLKGSTASLTQFFLTEANVPNESNVGYILNGCPSGGGSSSYGIRLTDGVNGSLNVDDTGSGNSYTGGRWATSPNCNIIIRAGYSFPTDGVIFYPMIRLSTESDANFAPYANVCPISGRTETTVNNRKNLAQNKMSGSVISNGVTWKKNADGSITVSGSATANSYVTNAYEAIVDSSMRQVVISGLANVTNINLESANLMDIDNTVLWNQTYNDSANHVIDLTNYPTAYKLRLSYKRANNGAVSGTIKGQVEVGSTPTTFVPYYTPKRAYIAFGQTVYGCKINFKTGEMIIDRVKETFDWSNATSPTSLGKYTRGQFKAQYIAVHPASASRPQLSDVAPYAAKYAEDSLHFYVNNTNPQSGYNVFMFLPTGTTSATFEVCYELLNPIFVQLTPAVLELAKGYNYITADGNMEISAVPEKLINYIVNAFGTDESGRTTASRPYAAKEYFYKDGFMYKVTTAIAQGAAFTVGTNCVQTTIFAELTALNG